MSFLMADAANVKAHIAGLMAEYPELAEDAEFLADVLEGETDLHKVVERCLQQRLEADEMAAAIKQRESDLAVRRKRFERASDTMKRVVRDLMEFAGQTKLVLPDATLSVTKPRESVEVTDLDALPQGFFKLTKSADRNALKAALMAGDEVPGATLALGESGLTIRKK